MLNIIIKKRIYILIDGVGVYVFGNKSVYEDNRIIKRVTIGIDIDIDIASIHPVDSHKFKY